ncbi:hypothetical protein E4U21_001652 [Claviceps maximensis]|nr:hypothetical protein E4U21_001652 [Claviceps maximensis]
MYGELFGITQTHCINVNDVRTSKHWPSTRIRSNTTKTCASAAPAKARNRYSNMQDFDATHHDGSARGQKRSNSQTRQSRPTTPLRPSSRSSFRDSARDAGKNAPSFPLNTFEPAFAELSDAMADLEANMMHFQLMHESLSRFSESFASFLYGMNMNAFCVDFPEGPIPESFGRHRRPETPCETSSVLGNEAEATFIAVTLSATLGLPTPHLSTIHQRPQRVEQSLHLSQIGNHAFRSLGGNRPREPQEHRIDEAEVEGAGYWALADGQPDEETMKGWP